MLVTSILSFSYNVFKRLTSQGRYKSGLCGKWLKLINFMDQQLHDNLLNITNHRDAFNTLLSEHGANHWP